LKGFAEPALPEFSELSNNLGPELPVIDAARTRVWYEIPSSIFLAPARQFR
jgi:hypothetical protein